MVFVCGLNVDNGFIFLVDCLQCVKVSYMPKHLRVAFGEI